MEFVDTQKLLIYVYFCSKLYMSLSKKWNNHTPLNNHKQARERDRYTSGNDDSVMRNGTTCKLVRLETIKILDIKELCLM